jgi:hypothetical protein
MKTITAAPMFRVNRSTRLGTADGSTTNHATQWLQPILQSRQCPRCQGLLVGDLFYDINDDQGQRWLRAMRCVQCGDVLDPTIVRNRLAALKHRQTEPCDAVPDRKGEFEDQRPLLRVPA